MSQSIEEEITIYAKIGNPDGLNQAISSEQQVQHEQGFEDRRGNARVRETTKPGAEVKYVFTFKVPTDGPDGAVNKLEQNFDIDKNGFDAFAKLATRHLTKTRYRFGAENTKINISRSGGGEEIDIPSIFYDVDVYTKSDGSTSEWCKIDVEIQSIMNALRAKYPDAKIGAIEVSISHLPFKPTDAIISTTDDADEKAKIGQIWEEFLQH